MIAQAFVQPRGYLASALPVGRPRAYTQPAVRQTPAAPKSLRRLECNPVMAGVSGAIWVRAPLSLPEALKLALRVSRHLSLQAGDLTVIEPVAELPAHPQAFGAVQRYQTDDFILDEAPGLRRLWLRGELGPLPEARNVTGMPWQDPRLEALLPEHPSVFVGGLVSISAEPPEGFFAASTAAELRAAGYPLAPARLADVWLYRVPDSRPESYFEFSYPTPDRPSDSPRQGKFKIAAGLGPAANPLSEGGREADLLWLGDEQHGSLREYLETAARKDLRLSHLTAHPGLVQRLKDGSVLISSVDKSHGLTRIGFDALQTEPELYRRVYSHDYDAFLSTLFEPVEERAKASYLLATSRGCTQGCAICCSGGLKPFQFFSATRIMEELAKLNWQERLRPWDKLDVFFLDSNFNNHAGRIIELAERYRRSRLYGRFRFFVRHNTVNGFLNADKTPHLRLIEAFRILGIREIWMGVDSYDDASTLTLKSHRRLLAKQGVAARPTYTFEELSALVKELEKSGAWVKGFYLQNNPWVSDLDRIDGWFNLLSLWLTSPRFSIDSREPAIHQLKPFAGSPIEQVARGTDLVSDGRFADQIDELRDVSALGVPRAKGDVQRAIRDFADAIRRLRQSGDELLLSKLRQREARLRDLLPECTYLAEIDAFAGTRADDFDESVQRELFSQKAASLIEGLDKLA